MTETLEEKLVDDILWENQMKALGITGWQLTKLFIERLYDNRREVSEGDLNENRQTQELGE